MWLMKLLSLTNGKVAILDDKDYVRASKFKWYASKTKKNGQWYAKRGQWVGEPTDGIGKNAKYGRTITIWLHRFVTRAVSGIAIDHKNGNTLDNRRSNLRLASSAQNQMNREKSEGKSSQFKGVYWDTGRSKWSARIKKDGKVTFLGRFDDEIEAAEKYNESAKVFFGTFALLNHF